MGSSRLPGKVMLDLCGKPVLYRLWERVKRSRLIHDIVIATTDQAQDNVIDTLARTCGIHVFRGSENDVLLRVLESHRWMKSNIIVRLCGDCPFTDPALIDTMVHRFMKGDVDIVTNSVVRTFPYGLDVQVFSFDTLLDVAQRTNDLSDREHVSAYIYNHPEIYRVYNYENNEKDWNPEWRWVLDYPEDYRFIKAIYERLLPQSSHFDSKAIVALLHKEPELLTINNTIGIALAKGQSIKKK